MITFLQQIDKIKEEFNLKDDIDFDSEIGTRNKLTRWRTGRDKAVSLKILLKIREKFGKSLDWLLFGDAWEMKTAERPAEPYLAPTYSEGDLQALAQITLDTEDFLKKSRLQISPERKYYFLQLNYEYWFTNRDRPDEIILKRNFDLSLGMARLPTKSD